MTKTVYLSPSTQYWNIYASGLGNERQRMNEVANYVESSLEMRGYTVIRNDPNGDVGDAVTKSKNYKLDCYVALHSNAAGGKNAGKARGCESYYDSGNKNSQRLSQLIYNAVNSIAPAKGRGNKIGDHLYEVKTPVPPTCLVEIAFHDNVDDASWIVGHESLIGITIAEAIDAYLQETPTSPSDKSISIGAASNTPQTQTEEAIGVTNFTAGKATFGQELYGRKYRILVIDKNGKALDVSGLRCTFNISKTIQIQANISEITIYNLSAETENTIIKTGTRIVVEAGYDNSHYGVIYDGDIVQVIRSKENGTDYYITLISMDGDSFLNKGFVSFTLSKGMTSRKIAENIASKAKNPIQVNTISESLSKAKLTRGKVVFGLSTDYLKQLSASEKATTYVNNGKLNIVKVKDVPKGKIIVLSPESGLVGTPEQNEYGLSGKALLNPQIDINGMVKIDNSLVRERRFEFGQLQRSLDADGIYRIIKLDYIGDTRGQDWYVEFEAITQAGIFPSMLLTEAQNPW